MTTYHYQAVNESGKTIKGFLEASHEKEVRDQLRMQGLLPLQIKLSKYTFAKWNRQWLRDCFQYRRISSAQLALLTRQFATLLSAGLPVEEALLAVAEQTETTRLKHIILSVRTQVMEGHGLGRAMEMQANVFSSLFSATVSAGERTGRLDHILLRLADYTEQQAAMTQKIKTASIYPLMIVLVSLGIVSFLLSYVVPKMVGVYAHMKQALPWMTTLLIGLSEEVQASGIYVLGGVGVLIVWLRYAIIKKPHFRRAFHRFILRCPLIGYAAKTRDTARFSRTLSILSTAGVPMLEGMQVASTLIYLEPLREAVMHAVREVREGGAIYAALKKTNYFSPMSIHMMASGEASGQLESMLERVALQQDNDITRLIDTSLALFEPTIILFMGAIVLFIVLAVLLPIFQLNDFMG